MPLPRKQPRLPELPLTQLRMLAIMLEQTPQTCKNSTPGWRVFKARSKRYCNDSKEEAALGVPGGDHQKDQEVLGAMGQQKALEALGAVGQEAPEALEAEGQEAQEAQEALEGQEAPEGQEALEEEKEVHCQSPRKGGVHQGWKDFFP